MKNNIATIERLTEKIPAGTYGTVKKAAVFPITFIVGFLLSRTALFSKCVPFGLGFSAGLYGALSSSAALGAAVGYFFPVTGTGGFGYVAAAVLIAGVRFVLPQKFKATRSPAFAALLAFIANLMATVPAIAAAFSAGLLVTRVAECAVCAATAACVNTAIRTGLDRDKLTSLPQKESICLTCVAGLILASLGTVHIGQVYITSVATVLLILCAASGGKASSGAASGAILGFFACVGGVFEPWGAAATAIGGLLAGILTELGEIGGAVAFVTSVTVYTLISNTDDLSIIYSACAGALIYLILPRKVRSSVSQIFAPPAEMPRLDGLKKSVSMRLGFASKALCDVSDTVEQVAQKLEKYDNPPLEKVMTGIEGAVCNGCSMRRYCWEEQREKTVAALVGYVRGESDRLQNGCGRIFDLSKAAKSAYEDHKNRFEAAQRVKEIREVMSDQFAGVADLLAEVSDEFDREQNFDHEAAQRVESALRSVDIIPSDISCSVDRYGRMTVEIRVPFGDRARFNKMTILKEVSSACGRDFDPPCICSAVGRGTLITLSQSAKLQVDTGLASLTYRDGKLCGDTATVFPDGRGHMVMILSDGMGTGGRAAIDSALVTGLMERLIKAGFGYDSALKIINSSLLFKSADESLATVDICSIDLFTGRAELFKAGACPTVVLKSGRTGIAEGASMPVGILRDVSFDTAAVNLSRGDIAVIFSDGAMADGTKWICDQLKTFSGGTAQQLAEHLASSARRRRTDGHDDDITVAVAVIG